MKIYTALEIKAVIDIERDLETIIDSQRRAFIDFSAGNIILPPPMQLKFNNGDCHIKAGFKKDDDIFVVKVATGFYNNPKKGLPVGDGAMLVFAKDTGALLAILCDGGFLTTLRTAIAAVVTSELTDHKQIGVIGTGNLGQLTAKLMKQKYPSSEIMLCGRDIPKTQKIAKNLDIEFCDSVDDLVSRGGLVVTTTASHEPMIDAHQIKVPTHIVALGADEDGKQELDISVLAAANKIIVDSKVQALKFGDTSCALRAGMIEITKLAELGDVLNRNSHAELDSASRIRDDLSTQLIVTDLTGLAAQDIAIAKFTLQKIRADISDCLF